MADGRGAVVTLGEAVDKIKEACGLDSELKGVKALHEAREFCGLETDPMPTMQASIRELIEALGLDMRLKDTGQAQAGGARAGAEPEPEPEENIYAKYSEGYEGDFGDESMYHDGLEKQLGARPQPDMLVAMAIEHLEKKDGFGASDTKFKTTNYGGQLTTPRNEWNHVADPDKAPDLPKGKDHTGKDLGLREKVDARELHKNMLKLIRLAFYEIGWTENAHKLTQERIDGLGVLLHEIVGLRCYTGPLFIIYNSLLRALGKNQGVVAFGIFSGQSVKGCFVTSIHAMNNGNVKLMRLSSAIQVYRGIAGMKLTKQFLSKDASGVRAGVELGFMSTTSDINVATGYSRANAGAPSTVFSATMSAASRGSCLSWLSQYPGEKEFLFSPLCLISVTEDPVEQDGVIHYSMRFESNPAKCEPDDRAAVAMVATERAELNFLKSQRVTIDHHEAHVQRNGKGRFVKVWIEITGSDLVISDGDNRAFLLARLDLAGAKTSAPKTKREDFPCAFRLDVCSKNHTWEGGWRDAKYIVAASSAIHIEKWNTEVQATVQVTRTIAEADAAVAEKRFDDAIGLVTHALSEYPGDERLSQAETRCREGKAEHKPTAVAQAVGAAEKTETSQAYGVQIAPPAAQPVASNPFQNLRMDAAGSRTSVAPIPSQNLHMELLGAQAPRSRSNAKKKKAECREATAEAVRAVCLRGKLVTMLVVAALALGVYLLVHVASPPSPTLSPSPTAVLTANPTASPSPSPTATAKGATSHVPTSQAPTHSHSPTVVPTVTPTAVPTTAGPTTAPTTTAPTAPTASPTTSAPTELGG